MSERSKLDSLALWTIIASAAVVAAAAGYRAFFARPGTARIPESAVLQVSDSVWATLMATGIRIAGAADAPVTVVEFTDLQCPACRSYQATLEGVLARRGADLRLLYVPYPLQYHRLALPAANAAECAAEAGGLMRWITTIYGGQDSLGLKGWGTYASEAGILDTAYIAQCAQQPAPAKRVRDGLSLGTLIGVAGTPTIVVHGLHFGSSPSGDRLESLLDSILSSRPELHLPLTLPGRVFDSALGTPLQGAAVALRDAAGDVIAHGQSDAAGEFHLRAREGWYRLHVTKPGYSPLVGRLYELRGALPPHVIDLAPEADAVGP